MIPCIILLLLSSFVGIGLAAQHQWDGIVPPQQNNGSGFSRGFVMCSGKRHIKYLRRNIFLMRALWNSTLPVAIAHCRELTADSQNLLLKLDSSIQFINLCAGDEVFGLPLAKVEKMLQGFYCKIGALLKSPFQETILMDVDVVWLERPELMFAARGYSDSGALFMRARMSIHDNAKGLENSRFVAPLYLLKYFQARGIKIDRLSAQENLSKNGINLFWHGIAQGDNLQTATHVDNIQDSSIVLVNKAKHPGMLRVLEEFLKDNFQMGYGDKELFWIASTIADEPFTFEPFASGQYGDCHGIMIHFDPSASSESNAKPWYANAEFMVERGSESAGIFLKELNVVGEYLHSVITKPINITSTIKIQSLNTWKFKAGKTGCTCLNAPNAPQNSGVVPCISAPNYINDIFIAYEWLTYSSSLHVGEVNGCIPYYLVAIKSLNNFFARYVKPEHCEFVGCPSLPIILTEDSSDLSSKWILDPNSQICDPVSFNPGSAFPLFNIDYTRAARTRTSEWNRPLLKVGQSVGCAHCGFKSIYLFDKDEKLHKFSGLKAFVKRGLDFKDTIQLKPHQFHSFELGEEITE